MSLTEQAINYVEISGRVPNSPSTSILNAYEETRSIANPSPSSIQSMLRNTTETGDIGQFSINPTRIPYPLSRASSRSSTVHYSQDGLPQHQINQLTGYGRHKQNRQGDSRQSSMQSTHDSSIISMYQTDSQKSYGSRTRHISTSDYHKALAMSQNSQCSYTVPHHQSYHPVRPRSPFPYPTRLKRPGYRPSSPALTDFNGTDSRTQFGLDNAMNGRDPSPFSAPQIRRRIPAGYPPSMNRSMPSLLRAQSPFARPCSRSSMAPPLPRLPLALRSTLEQGVGPSYYGRQHEAYRGSPWPHLQPPSLTPKYYDYSEAFQLDQHVPNAISPILPLGQQTTPEIHGLVRTTSHSEFARTVAQSLSPERQPSVPTYSLESPSPVTAPRKILQQMTQWEKQETDAPSHQDEEPKREQRDSETGKTVILVESQVPVAACPSVRDTIGHHILSSSKLETKERFTMVSKRSTNDSASLALSVSRCAPFDGALVPVQLVDSEQMSDQKLPPTPSPLVRSSALEPWQIPTMLFRPLALGTRAQSLSSISLSDGTGSFKKENIVSQPIIQAPVPERSTSSRTNTDRFSRILSIDEGFADLAQAVLESDLKLSHTTRALPLHIRAYDSSINRHNSSAPSSITDQSLAARNIIGNAVVQDLSSGLKPVAGSLQLDNDIPPKDLISIPSIERMTTSKKYGSITPANLKPSVSARTSSLGSSRTEQHLQPFRRITKQYSPCSPFADANETSVCDKVELVQALPVMPLLEAARIVPWEYEEPETGHATPIGRFKLKSRTERLSLESVPGSQDTIYYPWTDPTRNCGLSNSRTNHDSPTTNAKIPRFRLKVTRASSSTNGTVRIKKPSSPASSPRPSFGLPTDLFRAGPFGRKYRAENMSEANRPFPTNTNFQEQIQSVAMCTSHSNLRPSSPSHQLTEVRSFFSDDSSNIEQRGSLRQRISQFRAIASRGNSTDDVRPMDRRQAGSALGRSSVNKRNSGRHSREDSAHSHGLTEGMSARRYTQWKMGEKFRTWWHKGEEKLKGWGGRVKKSSRKRRPRSTEMYAGV